MGRWASLLASLLLLASCGYGAEDRARGASSDRPGTDFGDATVIIDTGPEVVMIDAEVAQTEQQRARGLMFRESLPHDAGMVFVFFEESRGPFWMKNTRIPLSIAFFGREGRIVAMLDMDPCRRDRCRLYDPGTAYWGALEVNQGAFERWGVEVGDRIDIVQ
jgi:uncharacterized membrane protein (UPF0127 family)